MTDIHRFLAIGTLALALAGLAWSAALAVTRRPAPRAYIVLAVVEIAFAFVSGSIGVLLLGTSHSPNDPLHLVYGLVSFVALPIAAVMAVGRSPRGQAVVMTIGWLVQAGVVVRLFQTG